MTTRVLYRTCDWLDAIDLVELISETPRSWHVREISTSGALGPTRYMKGGPNQLHRSWEAAHAHLVKRAEKLVQEAVQNVAFLQTDLERIKAMKKEALQ